MSMGDLKFGLKKLPKEYTEVEYIEGVDQSTYIDTGIPSDIEQRFIFKAYIPATVNRSVYWMRGSVVPGTADIPTYSFVSSYTGDYIRLCHSSNGKAWPSYLETYIPSPSNRIYNVEVNKNGATVNGNHYNLSGGYIETEPVNCFLFGLNDNGIQYDADFCNGLRIYYFQIIDGNGNTLRDLVPCINENGIAGMYDSVSGTFFGSSGDGAFIHGPVKAQPSIKTELPYSIIVRHWKKSRGGRLNWVKDEDVRKVYINQETKENLVWRNGYDNVIVAKSNWSDPECEFYKRSDLDWELIEEADGNYLLGADGNIGNYINSTDVAKIEKLHGLEKLKTFVLDHCNILEEVIGIEEWDTSNRTSLQAMFRGCASFIKPDIDLSKWNVSNVTNIHYMFFNSGFTSIDLHGWDARKVTTTGDVFYGSKNLETIDLSNWKTPSKISFSGLCYNCTALKSINFSGWDWKNIKITSLTNAFVCKNLENLDVTDWDISEAYSIAAAFRYCEKLSTLNVSKWNTANITAMNSTFEGCSGLTVLDVSNWVTDKVVSLAKTFRNCTQVEKLDVSKWNTGKVTNLEGTFSYCGLIKELEVSNWNTSNVENLYNTFGHCTSLIKLDLHNWDVSKVTDMSYLFNVCSSLKSVDLTGWDTSNVLDMSIMFYGCGSMKWVDISGWTIKEDTIVDRMFAFCPNLTDIYAYDCDETTISILNSVKPEAATLHTGPRPTIE